MENAFVLCVCNNCDLVCPLMIWCILSTLSSFGGPLTYDYDVVYHYVFCKTFKEIEIVFHGERLYR